MRLVKRTDGGAARARGRERLDRERVRGVALHYSGINLHEQADRRIPRAMVVRPHSDFVAHPCPGDELRRYIERRGGSVAYSPRRRRDTNETSRASRVVD
jgi:hypothetical protein